MKNLCLVFIFTLAFANATLASNFGDFFGQKVRSRAQWGALPAKADMTADSHKEIFAVHHSAGTATSDDATVQSIQRFHMEGRKWSDIGYHFLVGPDGKIFEGRSLNFAGAHVYGHNKGSVGVNFLGCYDSVECHAPSYPAVANVTDAMVQSMGELIGMLAFHYNVTVDDNNVRGHKEFSGTATSCPGDRIINRLPEIRRIACESKERAQRSSTNNHDEL